MISFMCSEYKYIKIYQMHIIFGWEGFLPQIILLHSAFKASWAISLIVSSVCGDLTILFSEWQLKVDSPIACSIC